MAYTLGPFTVALIVNSTGQMDSRWAYRAVFVSQYAFAAVAAVGAIFMPESPWWLASKDRHDQALKSLQKLGHKNGEDQKRLSNIRVTLEEIRRETDGVTYFECFRKSNLRRTIVSLSPITIQQLTGIVFAASYSTYYMQLAGYSVSMSFRLQITQQVLSIVGNMMSWDLIDRLGRRPLTIYGLVGLTAVLWVMGGLAVGGTPAMLQGTVAMILVYCWLYNVTIGATSWTVVTETATARLRSKTVAIGNVSNSLIAIIWQFAMPYMFNPDQGNLGGRVGFIFGGLSFVCIGYLWWYMPETGGRSYEELDEMFMKKVPARKFSSYKTEVEEKGARAQQTEAQT